LPDYLISALFDCLPHQAVRAIHYLALDNTETQRAIVQQGATAPLIALLAGERTGDSLHHAGDHH
jgi:hypothetical protein